MEPVPRAVDADHPRVGKVARPAVRGRITGAALLAVEEQGGAGDAAPQTLDVLAAHVVGEPRTHVVVELPAIGPVLVLVHAVLGEMTRLRGGEVRVLLLHAAEGVLDGRIAAGGGAGHGPRLLYTH